MIKIYPPLKKIIFFLSILGSICFIIISLKNALIFSADFQRSGAKALSLGLDPFLEYKNGNLNNIFIKYQAPNYLQTLYFLLLPFTFFSEPIANVLWGICNVLMLFSSTYMLGKIYQIKTKPYLFFLFFVLISGVPARNCIGNGQLSIFTMYFFLLGILIKQNSIIHKKGISRMFLYGLSYLKYSFAPTLGFFNFIVYGFRSFFISCLPAILGVVTMWLIFRTPTSIYGPFKVAFKAMSINYGIGDLLSILSLSFKDNLDSLEMILSFFCISLSLFLIFIARNFSIIRLIPLTSLVSLIFVKHLIYDYVFYLILLAFAFSSYSTKLEKVVIFFNWLIIGYGIWFLNKLNFDFYTLGFITSIFILNFTLLILIFAESIKNQKKLTSNT